jgi:hypothetical protein
LQTQFGDLLTQIAVLVCDACLHRHPHKNLRRQRIPLSLLEKMATLGT